MRKHSARVPGRARPKHPVGLPAAPPLARVERVAIRRPPRDGEVDELALGEQQCRGLADQALALAPRVAAHALRARRPPCS